MTAEASTRPIARTSTGTDSCVTGATLTGVGGGGPADCTFSDLHALIKTDSAITPKAENRITRVVSYYIAVTGGGPAAEGGICGLGGGDWGLSAIGAASLRNEANFGVSGLDCRGSG